MKTTKNNAASTYRSLKTASLLSRQPAEKTRIFGRRQHLRLAFLAVLTVGTFVSLVSPVAAGAITMSQLAGSWKATLVIDGGCGQGTKLVTFKLNSTGAGSATALYHTPACGDNSETGTIQITSLNSDGAGTAQLIFGSTAFHFYIQASRNTQVFNMVDISDSANYEEGSAIRQPASIALAKLAGQWEASLFIQGGCGFGTKQLIFSSFANGDDGAGSALENYDTSGCGRNAENGAIVNTALSTNGSGTSLFNFGSAFNFYIQASPNGQVVNMVDISDVGNYEEGMAIVQDNGTAATPTVSALAGSWQATLFIDGGCGLGTKLVTFDLGSPLPGSDIAQGIAAAEYHTQGCGNNTETGTIQITLDNSMGNGSGTAQLTFGSTVFNFNIQVAPNAQVFNLVDSTDARNYEEGSAIRQ
jgi:hypothetical protein